MRFLILLFCLCQSHFVPAATSDFNAETEVTSLPLPPRARNLLLQEGIRTLGHHRNTFFYSLTYSPNSGRETVRAIKTAFEAAGFPIRERAQIPPLTKDAPISALHLPMEVEQFLYKRQVFTLGDHQKISTADLYRAPGFGQVKVNKIRTAFEEAGFPIPLPADMPLAANTPISMLRLPMDVEQQLYKRNVFTLGDRNRVSAEELYLIRGFGKLTIGKIKVAFEQAGFPIPATYNERVCGGNLKD